MKGQAGVLPVPGECFPDDADGGLVDVGKIGGAGEGDRLEGGGNVLVGTEPGDEEFRLADRVVSEEDNLIEGEVTHRLGQGAEADGLALGDGPEVRPADP